GQLDKSLLLAAVRHEGKRTMPPKKKLTDEEVAVLTKWIKDGAAWPEVRLPFALGKPRKKYETLKKEHWAFQPLRQTKAPAVRNASWVRSTVDRYILAGLEGK